VIGRLTGQPVLRTEDARLLTGRGCYVDDVAVPGLLHAAFVRSPHAHARIARVDVGPARLIPGVVSVYADAELRALAADIEPTQMTDLIAPTFAVLARDKVRTVGDPVAMVVAESRYLAEDACDAVVVDYEPLPPVVDAEAAMAADAPLVFDEAGTNVVHRRTTLYGEPDRCRPPHHRAIRAAPPRQRAHGRTRRPRRLPAGDG